VSESHPGSGSDENEPEVIVDGEVVESEVIAPMPAADTGYSASGVPTFEAVREKIETRYGTAIGSAELAAETPEGRSVEEDYEARQKAAADRLEQIRASMRDDPDA
jgi:phage shock protein A